jgi:hypothetical protein
MPEPCDHIDAASLEEDLGSPRWPGLFLAWCFALMIGAELWARLLKVCRIKRRDYSPSVVATKWKQPSTSSRSSSGF